MENEKILMLDSETTNDIECPLVYDIGFAVVDIYGNTYEEGSFVIADIFLDKELMSTAYFADKIPTYWEDIKSGKRLLRRYKTVRYIVADVIKQYNIKYVCCHNTRFDYCATATTQRYLTSSKFRYFFPYGTQFLDTLKMSREIFKNDIEYCEFCERNNFVTKHNKPKFTAEILYRFLTNDLEFEEEHTGLADVRIEKEILKECLRRNPSVNGRLWE